MKKFAIELPDARVLLLCVGFPHKSVMSTKEFWMFFAM